MDYVNVSDKVEIYEESGEESVIDVLQSLKFEDVSVKDFWKVLVLSRDSKLFDLVKPICDGYIFQEKKIKLFSVKNALEAEGLLEVISGVSVLLVSDDMGEEGLRFVNYIRDIFINDEMRIIMIYRKECSLETAESFDIDGSLGYDSVSTDRLLLELVCSFRTYDKICELKEYTENLELEIEDRNIEVSSNIQVIEELNKRIEALENK